VVKSTGKKDIVIKRDMLLTQGLDSVNLREWVDLILKHQLVEDDSTTP
jgi:hypothetical protein